ncbi:MAG: AAA family ATPase [Magnetococcus sp. YQC-9]
MYLDHFGFHAPPFAITPDTELFFAGGERGAILEQLLKAVESGEGFIKVVGEVGSGKTMLCRLLCRKLPERTRVALLLNPAIPPEELISALLREFRLPEVGNGGEAARHQALLEFFVSLERQQEQAVIVIEEAQCLPPATLEALRLISNLETEHVKLVSIILFGQPELNRKLQAPGSRQILERITTHLSLPSLTLNETDHYLRNRVHAVGYRGPQLFSSAAVRTLHRAARGSLRQTNLLAEKSLIHASRSGAHLISNRHVSQGIASLADKPSSSPWRRPALAAGAVLALLAGGISLNSSASLEIPWLNLSEPVRQEIAAPVANPLANQPTITPASANQTNGTAEASDHPISKGIAAASQANSTQAVSTQPGTTRAGSNQTHSIQATASQTITPEVDNNNLSDMTRSTPPRSEAQPAPQADNSPGSTWTEAKPTKAVIQPGTTQAGTTPIPAPTERLAHASNQPGELTSAPNPPAETVVAAVEVRYPPIEMGPTPLTLARTLNLAPLQPLVTLAHPDKPTFAPVRKALKSAPKPTVHEIVQLPGMQKNDPLHERVRAAHRWLATKHGTRYTIQLIQLRNDAGIRKLEQSLTAVQPELHPSEIKVFRLRNQKLLVYLGDFENEYEAQEALLRLPHDLLTGRPLVVPLERVKSFVHDRTRPEKCLPGQENRSCAPSA